MTKRTHLDRRTLLKGMAATSLLPLLGANLVGCSDGSDQLFATVPAEFLHGVASGDPLTDRVILWTRLTPESAGQVAVAWEVSESPDFAQPIARGQGTTSVEVDYTVKVDVTGLAPNRRYYYRFSSGDRVSPVGRTRTLPLGAVAMASFAVVSCSKFPTGFFNVYRELSQQDVDAVLHLGDYFYESGDARDGEALGRVVDPPREILSLDDYRTRYAQYRRDEDLQAAHRAHPFITVWDDHELANNAWRDGAQNHQPDEGDFGERKMAAIQAWYEWQPVRPPSEVEDIIYRRFQYGDLLDLLMLDTRIIGRDRQLDYRDFSTGGMIDIDAARAAIDAPERSLLGDDQRAWLREQLSQSAARWQVLGQQVLLSRFELPAAVVEALELDGGSDDDALTTATAVVLAAVAAKSKAPGERTAEEQALLDSAIPFNLDQWDGYAYERDQLLRHAVDVGANLVVLSGDSHNAWSSQLTTPEGVIAGVEFGCTSVTSTGFENQLGEDAAVLFTPLAADLIDDLKRANLSNRGYLYMELTPQAVRASHRFVTTTQSRDYAVDDSKTIEHTVLHGDMRLT